MRKLATTAVRQGDRVIWRYTGKVSGEPKAVAAKVVRVWSVNVLIQVGSKGYIVKPAALELAGAELAGVSR